MRGCKSEAAMIGSAGSSPEEPPEPSLFTMLTTLEPGDIGFALVSATKV